MPEDHGTPEAWKLPRLEPELVQKKGVAKVRAAHSLWLDSVNEMRGVSDRMTFSSTNSREINV